MAKKKETETQVEEPKQTDVDNSVEEVKQAGDFVLTDENYYSIEANKHYMSFHQYLDFCGGMGILNNGCEARAMARLNGEYSEETTKAMLIGSYVDSWFEGTLDKFKAEHPEIFTQKGELKADFKLAEKLIERCSRDEKFMQYMSGEKQKIVTGYMFGTMWRGKLDSYIPHTAIVDLKTSASIHKAFKSDNGWLSFVEAYSYIEQLSVYQELVRIETGEKLPCFIAAVSKEEEPEIAVIYIDQDSLDNALKHIEENMPKVLAIKNGDVAPIGCGKCDYCKSKMKIKKPIHFSELLEGY